MIDSTFERRSTRMHRQADERRTALVMWLERYPGSTLGEITEGIGLTEWQAKEAIRGLPGRVVREGGVGGQVARYRLA